MNTSEYFPSIAKIEYEGPNTDNHLAFRYYDENKKVAGKTMKDHFRFAVAYWHSFCGDGSDPLGLELINFRGIKAVTLSIMLSSDWMPLLSSLQN